MQLVLQNRSLALDDFGTGKIEESKLIDLVRAHVDLRPAGIIQQLDLLRPIYRQTAAYGHFGRTDVDLPWERLDLADKLKKEI